MITRDQRRAQSAFQRIKDVERSAWPKEYGRQCLRLPALIHQCGLCQALAFLQAKGAKRDECRQLLADIVGVAGLGSAEHVRDAELTQYQILTREALACAQWFKRYAEAILRVEAGGEEGGV